MEELRETLQVYIVELESAHDAQEYARVQQELLSDFVQEREGRLRAAEGVACVSLAVC